MGTYPQPISMKNQLSSYHDRFRRSILNFKTFKNFSLSAHTEHATVIGVCFNLHSTLTEERFGCMGILPITSKYHYRFGIFSSSATNITSMNSPSESDAILQVSYLSVSTKFLMCNRIIRRKSKGTSALHLKK